MLDNRYWYVEAEWEDGSMDVIGEFNSISDAWRWIAHRSRAWIEERAS